MENNENSKDIVLDAFNGNIIAKAQMGGKIKRMCELLIAEKTCTGNYASVFSDRSVKMFAENLSACLAEVPQTERKVYNLLKMLDKYRVFCFLDNKKSVSPYRLLVLLQDNYPHTGLCSMLNLLINGDESTESKAIVY